MPKPRDILNLENTEITLLREAWRKIKAEKSCLTMAVSYQIVAFTSFSQVVSHRVLRLFVFYIEPLRVQKNMYFRASLYMKHPCCADGQVWSLHRRPGAVHVAARNKVASFALPPLCDACS